MEILEIKHLAPYLPYGLEMELLDYSLGRYTRTLKLDCGHDFHYYLQNNLVRPILHPLSDLTKEIEHNGERFVPFEWISENLDYDGYSIDYCLNHTERLPYEITEKLLEWHFDVKKLIEKDLAIDINN